MIFPWKYVASVSGYSSASPRPGYSPGTCTGYFCWYVRFTKCSFRGEYDVNCLLVLYRSLRVDVRCNSGTFVGSLLSHSCDLMEPIRMNFAELETTRKRLSWLKEMRKSGVVSELIWSSLRMGTTWIHGLLEAVIGTLMRMLTAYMVQDAVLDAELRLFGLHRRESRGASTECWIRSH